MKKRIIAIFLAGIWITASEFIRNEILFKAYWTEHYNNIGLLFKTLPLNGILWTIWSFILAFLIQKIRSNFSRFETLVIGWTFSFLLMWITLFNLQVLPVKLLLFAFPLSFVEIIVSIWIIDRLLENKT